MLVGKEHLPGAATEHRATICWMHQKPLKAGKKYLLKHTTRKVPAVISKLENRINVSTLETESAPSELNLNDIGELRFQTAQPLVFDGYETNRLTGSFILIEQGTNATAGAGMLFPPSAEATVEYNDFAI
jgi:sulfate adenylyltransferase subunit 1 (EFTu-like GTPase family)